MRRELCKQIVYAIDEKKNRVKKKKKEYEDSFIAVGLVS